MNQKQLKELIKQGESQYLDFKRTPANIGKDICGFANTNDGIILVGVSDDGKPVGVSDKKEEDVANAAYSLDKPVYPEIEKIKSNGKTVLMVKVKKSSELHTYKGYGYKRIGSTNKPMSIEELVKRANELGIVKFDSQVCKESTLEDIDDEKVKWYLEQREITRNMSRKIKIPINQFLQNIKALEGDKPTYAGILFFGKVPQKFLLNARLRVVKFKGTKVIHPTLDTANCEGTIWEMVNTAEDFIRKNIRLLGTRTETSFRRKDKFEYPIKAVKEAILNALIHRNYLETGDVRVFIFDNRIEIINPGNFPEGVTPENPAHKPVNENLCQFVYDIGFIEKYGSGIYMMRDLSRKWGNKEPYYDLHPIETRIIFESPIKETSFIETDEFEGLNERQRNMMMFLYKYGKFTRKDYASETNISLRHTNREINELINKGKIIKHGEGRGVYYTLS